MKLAIIALFLWLIFAWFELSACDNDFQCQYPARCLKQGYSIYGVCAGGMNPGNSYDQSPRVDSYDPSGSYGNTCNFDIECGIGHRCAKETSMDLTGVCL